VIDLPTRYENVLGTLAGGGMSETLLCEDAHLKRKVVVKALKPGIEPHRLMDELAALSAIRSKHVVQVLDVIKNADGNVVGFVEEYIEGDPLSCSPTPASAEQALKRIYPIASGVADIHSHKRVHRDLKPDNMRIDNEGTLKIFDFGLSKLDDEASTSTLYFTSGYAAPELFKKSTSGKHQFTSAVDVFAFGVTSLWTIVGGVIPKELHEIPPSLPCVDFHKTCIGSVPHIADLLNTCVDSDPVNRPSMADVREHIGKQLLFDRHRMLLTHGGAEYRLDAAKRKVNLSGSGSSLEISYDGRSFTVSALTGQALVNNNTITTGYIFSGSVVIVLGVAPHWPVSITADISHPEVIL